MIISPNYPRVLLIVSKWNIVYLCTDYKLKMIHTLPSLYQINLPIFIINLFGFFFSIKIQCMNLISIFKSRIGYLTQSNLNSYIFMLKLRRRAQLLFHSHFLYHCFSDDPIKFLNQTHPLAQGANNLCMEK